MLGGCELPWVKHAKHLGHGLSEDLMEKRAHYINRVNELNQKFYFANSSTKIKINNIFNSSFYGSQIWDLFSDEAIRLEKLWNISIRILLDIPRNTYRYFIEPLSGTPHYGEFVYKILEFHQFDQELVERHTLTGETFARETLANFANGGPIRESLSREMFPKWPFAKVYLANFFPKWPFAKVYLAKFCQNFPNFFIFFLRKKITMANVVFYIRTKFIKIEEKKVVNIVKNRDFKYRNFFL